MIRHAALAAIPIALGITSSHCVPRQASPTRAQPPPPAPSSAKEPAKAPATPPAVDGSLLPPAPADALPREREPMGAFAHPCDETRLVNAVRSLLTQAGWTVDIETNPPEDELGTGMTVGHDGDTGEVRIGCQSPKGLDCRFSESDYLIETRTTWIEQSAASFELMGELLEQLAPFQGTVRCFGSDQIDLEVAYWRARGRTFTYLTPGDCRGAFSLGRKPGTTEALIVSGHAAILTGSPLYWIDPTHHPSRLLATQPIESDTLDVRVVEPACDQLRQVSP